MTHTVIKEFYVYKKKHKLINHQLYIDELFKYIDRQIVSRDSYKTEEEVYK